MPSRNSIRNHRLRIVAFIAVLLSGCAELPVPPEPIPSQSQVDSVEAIKSFRLSGRIAVKHDGQGFSGTLRWAHDALHDEVFLLSPLGQGVARIERTSSGVTLTTSDEKTYRADNVEALTHEVLGWQLPLQGLEHWVLGMPAPESTARRDFGASGQLSRLTQNGWQVDYARYQMVQGVNLPAKLEITHRGALDVRLAIDRWILE